MSLAETISPLLGRWALAWFFLSEAFARANNWDGTVSLMAMQKIPAAPLLFALALIVMVMGGLALALGYQVKHGAMLLFAFTVVASVAMHDFWKISNVIDRASDYEIFARNIAIAGGLLLLVGMGGGPLSLDNRGGGGKKRR